MLVMLGIVGTACGRDARGAEQAERDAALGAAVANVPAITPILLPNGDEPDAVSMPSGVALVPGGVAIVDQFTLKLHVFRTDGSLVGSAGGKGEGPGEFTSVAALVNIGGDSIATWDPTLRRMSVFTSEPKFVRSERFETDGATHAMSRLLGRLADGRFVVLHQGIAFDAVSADEPVKIVETANFLRVGRIGTAAGDSADKVMLPPTRQLVMLQSGGNSMSVGVPAYRMRRVAACEHGIMIEDDSSATLYDQELNMSRRTVPPAPTMVMTASDRRQMLEGEAGMAIGSARSRALAMLDHEQPKVIRVRMASFVDADSRMLFSLRGASMSARVYQRQTLDGTVLDTVHLPDAHLIFADARTVVALRTESDTTEAQVRMYRLPAPRVASVTALGRCNSAYQY